jgi:hypothetical protein
MNKGCSGVICGVSWGKEVHACFKYRSLWKAALAETFVYSARVRMFMFDKDSSSSQPCWNY